MRPNTVLAGIALRNQGPHQIHTDSTFEAHYSIGDLAKQWRLRRETVRLLVKDEPGVGKVPMGQRKASHSIASLNQSRAACTPNYPFRCLASLGPLQVLLDA